MPQLTLPTRWRTHPHTVNGYLYAFDPSVVFAASVNDTFSSYPIYQFEYDNVTTGAYTDVQVGMTVRLLTSEGNFNGWARVRLAPDGDTMYIGAIPSGDSIIEDDDLFEVLDDYRIWARIPYINASNPLAVAFYKDRDLAYSGQNLYPDPVSNCGPHVAGFVEDDGYFYVSFLGATNSYAVAQGASIATYVNDIEDGTYVTGNSASGDFDAKFPAGARWVTLSVFDSNGRYHTSRRLVVACERTGSNAPIQVRLADLRLSLEQTNASFTILADDASTDVIPQGTLVIYFEEEKYDGIAGSLNCWNYADLTYKPNAGVKFVGWTTGNSERVEPLQDDMTLQALGPTGIMANLPMFSQSVSNNASPANWNQMANLTLFRFLIYLLRWHTTALEVCDLIEPDWAGDYVYHRFDVSAGTAFSVVDDCAKYVNANLTCDRGGSLFLPRDQQMMTDDERDLVTTTITLADSDWSSLDIDETDRSVAHWLRGSGLLASRSAVTPYLSIAPGKSPGQGGMEESLDNQLVTGQTDLNVRTGRAYGLRNIKWPSFSFSLINAGLIADPAWREWASFVLTADHTKRQTTIND